MGKRNRYRDHCDPEVQRWGRTYPRFPGVAECARLIRARKATGTWAYIVAEELAENASDCLEELIDTFREDMTEDHNSDDVAMYVMMALDIAKLPASVEFLSEVLQEGDPRFTPYARSALEAIDTRESRTALFHATHAEQTDEREPD